MERLTGTLLFLLVTALPLRADVKRALSIEVPAEVAARGMVAVAIHASTDASDGEQIGFMQAEYSIDDGLTWGPLCADEKSGAKISRTASFVAGAKGERAIVRARVAFRGGAAGDVDFRGGTIDWNESWGKWRWPPAKYVLINVQKPLEEARPVERVINRVISIEAPAEAAPGSAVSVSVRIGTDASDGEQIGFAHAEYSVDEGQTWTQFCYAEKSGAGLSRRVSFATGPKPGKAMVRVRAAFRGGTAGDVDYRGGAIQWGGSWGSWQAPAAKYAIIYVRNSVAAAAPVRTTVKREIDLQAPAEAAAGSKVTVVVHAGTDANDGEEIGILHAEYSLDEGKTWTPLFYAGDPGAQLSRKESLAVNAQGGKTIVRLRVAFRGGRAGDVDYRGEAIRWSDSWEAWRSPPAKYFIIYPPKP